MRQRFPSIDIIVHISVFSLLYCRRCYYTSSESTEYLDQNTGKEEDTCNGANKTRGVRIHLQAFIGRHGQNHSQGRTNGKQV